MFSQRRPRLKAQKPVQFFALCFRIFANLRPQFFVLDKDFLFLREGAHLCNDIQRIHHIDGENAKEYADEKRKLQIMRQPLQCIQDVRMYQKIIRRTQKCPENGKLQTDNSLKVEFFFAVVPKLNMQSFDKDYAGYVFKQRHHNRHHDKKQELAGHRHLFNQTGVFNTCQQIQSAQSKAVQRQIRTYQKARIYPFPAHIFFFKAPKYHFDSPAYNAAHKEQKC